MAVWPTHRAKAQQQKAKTNWLRKQKRLTRRLGTKNVPAPVNDALV